jgi:hypothetical protein
MYPEEYARDYGVNPAAGASSPYTGWSPAGAGLWERWDQGGRITSTTAQRENQGAVDYARQNTTPQTQFALAQQTALAGQQTPITPGMLNPGRVAPIRPPSFAEPGRPPSFKAPIRPPSFAAPEAPKQGFLGRLQDSRRVSTTDFDRQQRLGQSQANTATTDALRASRNVSDPGRSVYDTRLNQMLTRGFTPDDPSYQWRMDQGMENLSRASAARGMLGSGNVLAELTDYAQGAASQEYGAQFNRLLGASQNATQQYTAAYDTLGRMLGQQQGQQQLGLAGNQFRLANEAQVDSRRQFRSQLGLDYDRLGLNYDQLNAQQRSDYNQLGLNYDQLNAQQRSDYNKLGFNYDQLNAQQRSDSNQLGLNYAQLNAQQRSDYNKLGFNYDQLASQQGVNYGELNLRRQAQADSTALDRAQFLQQGNQFSQDQAQDWARVAQGWGNQALGFSAGDTNAYNASVNAGQLALERNRFNANETRLNNYDQGIGAGLMSGAGIFGG